MTRAEQIQKFLSQAGMSDAQLQPLAGDASFRRYVRILHAGKYYMLMDAPPDKEDVRPYITIAEYLCQAGYSAPEIIARDVTAGLLLLSDLGDDTFTRVLKKHPSAQQEQLFYEAAIDVLARWHHADSQLASPQRLPLPSYDTALLLREVALFADWFLPQCVGVERARGLRDEYMALWEKILGNTPLATDQFVHRDYHADNLMWLLDRMGTARVGLLDFQDGVYGDAAYDVVSLLEDARRDVPPSLIEAMLARYVQRSGADSERFARAYAVLGAQRNSKIVGIFARLAARDGKAHYLDYLPRVWGHLHHDLSHPALAELAVWVQQHVPQEARGVIRIHYDAQALALSA
jgi:aminoglycoside/choline kinase family phosphotransferase